MSVTNYPPRFLAIAEPATAFHRRLHLSITCSTNARPERLQRPTLITKPTLREPQKLTNSLVPSQRPERIETRENITEREDLRDADEQRQRRSPEAKRLIEPVWESKEEGSLVDHSDRSESSVFQVDKLQEQMLSRPVLKPQKPAAEGQLNPLLDYIRSHGLTASTNEMENTEKPIAELEKQENASSNSEAHQEVLSNPVREPVIDSDDQSEIQLVQKPQRKPAELVDLSSYNQTLQDLSDLNYIPPLTFWQTEETKIENLEQAEDVTALKAPPSRNVKQVETTMQETSKQIGELQTSVERKAEDVEEKGLELKADIADLKPPPPRNVTRMETKTPEITKDIKDLQLPQSKLVKEMEIHTPFTNKETTSLRPPPSRIVKQVEIKMQETSKQVEELQPSVERKAEDDGEKELELKADVADLKPPPPRNVTRMETKTPEITKDIKDLQLPQSKNVEEMETLSPLENKETPSLRPPPSRIVKEDKTKVPEVAEDITGLKPLLETKIERVVAKMSEMEEDLKEIQRTLHPEEEDQMETEKVANLMARPTFTQKTQKSFLSPANSELLNLDKPADKSLPVEDESKVDELVSQEKSDDQVKEAVGNLEHTLDDFLDQYSGALGSKQAKLKKLVEEIHKTFDKDGNTEKSAVETELSSSTIQEPLEKIEEETLTIPEDTIETKKEVLEPEGVISVDPVEETSIEDSPKQEKPTKIPPNYGEPVDSDSKLLTKYDSEEKRPESSNEGTVQDSMELKRPSLKRPVQRSPAPKKPEVEIGVTETSQLVRPSLSQPQKAEPSKPQNIEPAKRPGMPVQKTKPSTNISEELRAALELSRSKRVPNPVRFDTKDMSSYSGSPENVIWDPTDSVKFTDTQNILEETLFKDSDVVDGVESPVVEDRVSPELKKKPEKKPVSSEVKDQVEIDRQILKDKADKKALTIQQMRAERDERRERANEQKEKRLKDQGRTITDPVLIEMKRKARQERQERRESLKEEAEKETIIEVGAEGMSVSDLAGLLAVDPTEVIRILFMKGVMVTVNQTLDMDSVKVVANEMEVLVVDKAKVNITDQAKKEVIFMEDEENATTRPPVVTVMGHVDHGKTSLLDYIRKSNIASGEAGGITQAIGAYTCSVETEGTERMICFLDTPGHEAFSAMRARGTKVTDIAIIIVAADDGVQPQTLEAISHAQAAEVPLLVAINKIDAPGADPDKVKRQLSEVELLPEEWGGNTPVVSISAKTGEGIHELLEMVTLVADIQLSLQANPDTSAKGTIIEAYLDKRAGVIATLLVQNGTLHVGDVVVSGGSFGKVRSLTDGKGKSAKEAGPSVAVQMLGLHVLPTAGDMFEVCADESTARSLAQKETEAIRQRHLAEVSGGGSIVTLSSLASIDAEDESQALQRFNIILKADTSGSLEAIRGALSKLPQDSIMLRFLHTGAGEVTESDVLLASASDGIVLGFNVPISESVNSVAKQRGIELHSYNVIYDLLDDVRDAMEGRLSPAEDRISIGMAEVKAVFEGGGNKVAGCKVTEGRLEVDAFIRVSRKKEVSFEGYLTSLRRVKEIVSVVEAELECGVGCDEFKDWQEGDVIEAFIVAEKRATLEESHATKAITSEELEEIIGA